MICGNPTCKYEFCWLCMKEIEPGHYENSPCAGKQFLDPESFGYQLELNYPCLYNLYMVALPFLLFIISLIFLALPFLQLSLIFFMMIYIWPNAVFDEFKSSIKFFIFLSDVFISLSIQSLFYIIEGIAFVIAFSLSILDIIILLLSSTCLEGDYQYLHCTRRFMSLIGNNMRN